MWPQCLLFPSRLPVRAPLALTATGHFSLPAPTLHTQQKKQQPEHKTAAVGQTAASTPPPPPTDNSDSAAAPATTITPASEGSAGKVADAEAEAEVAAAAAAAAAEEEEIMVHMTVYPPPEAGAAPLVLEPLPGTELAIQVCVQGRGLRRTRG